MLSVDFARILPFSRSLFSLRNKGKVRRPLGPDSRRCACHLQLIPHADTRDPFLQNLALRNGQKKKRSPMSTNIEATSEDESSRLELSRHLEKLQATVCYLIHINQELRQSLHEL